MLNAVVDRFVSLARASRCGSRCVIASHVNAEQALHLVSLVGGRETSMDFVQLEWSIRNTSEIKIRMLHTPFPS